MTEAPCCAWKSEVSDAVSTVRREGDDCGGMGWDGMGEVRYQKAIGVPCTVGSSL